MSGSTPRRPASSRGGVQRPRKIAGQRDTARPDETSADAPEAGTTPEAPAVRTTGVSLAKAAGTPPTPGPSRPGVLARQKTTRVLIATLVLVALALGSETVLFVLAKVDDDPAPAAQREASGVDGVDVPDDRPVIAADLDVKEGVDAAAKAAQEIVAVDFQKYDDEVDQAADLMTTRFETSYRETAAAIKTDFVANKTVVVARVVAQGVVKANRTRLQALVFLDQNVQRTREGKPEVVSTPFKVLVTMVHTDQGWLVDGLDTNATQDNSN